MWKNHKFHAIHVLFIAITWSTAMSHFPSISKEYQFHQNTFKLEVLVIISYYFNLVLVFLTFMTQLLLKLTNTSSDGTWSHKIFLCQKTIPNKAVTSSSSLDQNNDTVQLRIKKDTKHFHDVAELICTHCFGQRQKQLLYTIKVCDVTGLFGTILDPFWLNKLLMCLIGQIWRLRNDHLQY